MFLKRALLYFGIVCLLFTTSKVYTQHTPLLSEIDTVFLMDVVRKLSSKEFEGRLPGSDGYNMAATYTAELMKQFKLRPVEKTSYFQYFNVEHNEILAPLVFRKLNTKGKYTLYKPGKDYICRGFTGKGIHTTEVVFCGYGISMSKEGYDDYDGVDVKDKVVMIFKENPSWQLKTPWPSSTPRYKALIAAQKGALGVILVSVPKNARTTQPIGSIATGDINEHHINTTSIHVSNEVANDILGKTDFNIALLQNRIDSIKKPLSFAIGSQVYTEIHTTYTKEKPTMNVIGVIEGNDPKLKDEFLIIGAHLDHVGKQGDEVYFPGANDNASGVAAALMMAKLFSEKKELLKRSVVFILFANEEQGLLGSKHYVKNPIIPLNKTIAMLNLDCIAHGDSIRIGNGKSAPVLWEVASSTDNKYLNLMTVNTWSGGGADATPFHEAGIPALYFVTTNSYTHLHLPSDTPETLNQELFSKITFLAYATAWEILVGNYKKEKVLK